MKFNTELLKTIIERDKCIIPNLNIKLTRDSVIEFVCHCGIHHDKRFGNVFIYGAFCNECTNKYKQDKTKKTNLDKYGVENVANIPIFQEKRKQTNFDKYGSQHPLQNKDIKEKHKETLMKNHGIENPMQSDEIRKKVSKTMKDKTELFKQRFKDKYGVESPMHIPEIVEKNLVNCFRAKEFTFPSGNTIKVQGYEPIVLKSLIDKGYKEDDIVTSRTKVPEIWYLDINGKKRRYYCDIYIQNENRIIEVKCKFTYELHLENNKLKSEACKEAGYKFEFWIFRNKALTIV
jgi:hypothetical protein